MSSKQTSKKSNVDNLDPRIAPKEMIITRRKSALQQRQLRLRNKDRMKSITQLLKGPPRSSNTATIKPPQKKVKTNEKTNKKKLEKSVNLELEEKEFYPNTLKRNVVAKKILLKPKYNMKVIAGTNKRKMGTPHRGLKSPPPFQHPNIRLLKSDIDHKIQRQNSQSPVCSSPELSMAEVIRLAEETHSLDDEDLMEILTCPSPVWWEDPPDSGYDEDAILMSLQKQEDQEMEDKTTSDEQKPNSEEHKQTGKQIGLNVNVENRDSKYQQKRSKLENLLGSIKNKILGCDNVHPVKTKISPQSDVDKSNISESTEEDMFSDISMNDEDVLKDLESIDIPIESNVKIEDKLNIIKEEIKPEVPKTMPRLKRCPALFKDSPKNSTDIETLSSDFDSISDTNVRFIEEDEGSKTSDTSPKNNDARNKRNVRTKTKINKPKATPKDTPEDTPPEKTVTVSQSLDKEIVSDLGLNDNTDIEYITVYKIMSNKIDSPKKADVKENNEQPKEIDVLIKRTKKQPKERGIFVRKTKKQIKELKNMRQLNSLVQKLKDRSRKKIKKHWVITPEEKSITSDKNTMLVSENNKVKYCYKCSSIFDTDECSYCKRKSKIEQNSCLTKQCSCINGDKCNCNNKSDILTCHLCDFKTNTKIAFDEHLLVHINTKDDNQSVNNNSIKPNDNKDDNQSVNNNSIKPDDNQSVNNNSIKPDDNIDDNQSVNNNSIKPDDNQSVNQSVNSNSIKPDDNHEEYPDSTDQMNSSTNGLLASAQANISTKNNDILL